MADRKNVTNSGVTREGSRFVVKKDLPDVQSRLSKFNELLNRIKTFPLGNTQDANDVLSSSSDKITSHTLSYLNKMKNTTGDDITRFLNKTLQNNSSVTNSTLGIRTAEDLFNNDSNNFSAFFFERYKNINNKYEDLRIITEYLFELEEAINTLRDSITGADDLVSMISREISFDDVESPDETNGKSNTSMNVSKVETLEKTYKLKEKIKQKIVPYTLTYGNFFVYTIPYKDIFAQYEYRKKMNILKGIHKESADQFFDSPVMESVLPSINDKYREHVVSHKRNTDISPVYESIQEKFNAMVDKPADRITLETVKSDMDKIMEGIEICNDEFTPFMEDSEIAVLSNDQARDEALKAYRKASTPDRNFAPYINRDKTATDAVVDLGEPDKASVDEYKDISGVFFKLYEPTRVIPVFVMDTCVGYYVLYETFGEIRNTILLNSSLNRANMAFSSVKRKELDDEVISVIADAICQSIDKKYVTDNPKFRELIVNAISYQEFYKRKFKVQFIPVNYMTHFRINVDSETHMGVSVLSKSLFYAKLYLSLLIFKIITILTKSNDMRVYYIKNAGINKNLTNRVQEIARSIKERQISFNDLASIQTIFSKVGTYKEAFIPMGKNGEKNIEFDILSGQDVQLNTDLMEMLRKNMITNSGVPAVLSSLMEEAEFSRTIVMQHSKYLARVIAYQADIEIGCTEMYQKTMRFEGGINEEAIASFKFSFVRPKTLNAQNMSELTNNADGYAEFLAKSMVDENDQNLLGAFKRYLVTKILLKGVINWDELENDLEKVKMQLKVLKKEKDLNGENQEQ